MPWIIIGLYFICLFVIFCYALLQLALTINYVRAKKRQVPTEIETNELPEVLIQLPIFNERYVVERLIDHVLEIDYPSEKLTIQVLDDSTDDTVAIIDEKLKTLGDKAQQIQVVRRTDRVGFKAGALDHGMKSTSAEYIAIFDADFLPPHDFLRKTLPHFQDEKVGVVQTRWDHINREESLLTRLQAFALDAHFSIEQVGRNSRNHFINFNGTAGIWRRKTIEDAGGWEHDTLTEDLDLSYRAQMNGWKFIYREDILSPAELPVAISALKSQQFRWIKGGAENFKKLSGQLISRKGLRFKDRIHGLGHLFNSSVYIFVFLAGILSFPLIFAAQAEPNVAIILRWMAVFFISTLFLMAFYWFSYREVQRQKWMKGPVFILRFFQFLTVSLGLSYYNTTGIIQAYRGKKTAFIRTPKFNTGAGKDVRKNTYLLGKIKTATYVEILLSLYFLTGMVWSVVVGFYGMIPFLAMLGVGFGSVAAYTIAEVRQKRG